MKNTTSFLCFLLLSSLLLSNSFIEPAMARIYAINCQQSCELRCAKVGMKDWCMKSCGICCAKCKCVPSGTFGNKHQCPCYRDYRNSKGKPKCP